MAHQVLSKDMAALVEAMRLAIQYADTTLHHEYTKSMLSAAHVLAMDAKNLLDVVECIRQRHPNIDWRAALRPPTPEPPPLHTPQPLPLHTPQPPPPHTSQPPPPHTPQPILPQNQTLTSQNKIFANRNQSYSPQNPNDHCSLKEEEPPRADFKIDQPCTQVGTARLTADPSKEHSSLPVSSNRVSTLIHNYNLYSNIEPQHLYGNAEVAFQHSSSVDETKIDSAPMESVKSRVQAISGKLDSPLYSVTKKVSLDRNMSAGDQG
ncbi:unnamed protein product [Diatraea saccharalis]|uniref:Focal AT domain-containing protein n=1 Tax=Diatraea saccharalis TaxID=40085 RepID=A0A9N9WH56_9NEOP|nr:unnamed protein product [Diatraea saccharalis]